jgi:hypothetical protein
VSGFVRIFQSVVFLMVVVRLMGYFVLTGPDSESVRDVRTAATMTSCSRSAIQSSAFVASASYDYG